MARLHIEVATRWAGATAGLFADMPILVAASVNDDAGLPVTGLPATAFHVRYEDDPDQGSFAAAISAFREMGAALTGAGEYSFVVRPNEELPQKWRQDELFLFITARAAGNHGQTVCAARYHIFGP
jgi:hypothetical protein